MLERSTSDDHRLAVEAAQWFARLNDGSASAEAREQFTEWLLRSPRHLASYLDVGICAGEISLASDIPSKDDLIAEACEDVTPANVVELHPSPLLEEYENTLTARVHRISRLRLAVAASLLVVAVVLGSGAIHTSQHRAHWETEIGEQRSVLLEEGSTVVLNTDSDVSVALSRGERRIVLNRGEARFSVAKDPNRPFIVVTPHALVRALGTVFNVHIGREGTVVSVIEGKVKVTQREPDADSSPASLLPNGGLKGQLSRELHMGEQALVTAMGTLRSDPTEPFSRAIEWPHHQISFRDETLSDLVAEFNRYHKQTLKIADPDLGTHQVDGTFDAFDHDSLLAYLERYHGVKVERRADGVIILRRKPQG